MSLMNKIASAEASSYQDVGEQSSYFEIASGETKRLRILSEPVEVAQIWMGKNYFTLYGKDNGCPFPNDEYSQVTIKWLCWVAEVNEQTGEMGEVVLWSMPHTVMKKVASYDMSADYSFDSKFPMPYDIIVTKSDDKGKINYDAVPARKDSPIPQEVIDQLEKKDDAADIVKNMKAKQAKADGNEYMSGEDRKSEQTAPHTAEEVPMPDSEFVQ